MITELPIQKRDIFKQRLRELKYPPLVEIEKSNINNRDGFQKTLDLCLSAVNRHYDLHKHDAEIYMCLLEDERVNAYAIRCDGFYVIAVNGLSYEKLRDFMVGAVSSYYVSAALGLDARNSPNEGRLPTGFDVVQRFKQTKPRDLRISRIADVMASCCITFLAYHEYAHIICGHLDALKPSKSQTFSIDETNYNLTDPDLALSYRTVELDADAFGAVQTFVDFVRSGRWAEYRETIDVIDSWYSATALTAITIVLLHVYFEKDSDYVFSDLTSHPPAGWRIAYSLATFCHAIEIDMNMEPLDTYLRFYVYARDVVFQEFRNSCDRAQFLASYDEWYSDDRSRWFAIEERWAALYNSLDSKKLPRSFRIASPQP